MLTATETVDTDLRACWANLLNEAPAFCARIQPIYALNGWKLYPFGSPDYRVPTAEELYAIVHSIAWEAYRNAPDGVSTARLIVRFLRDRRGKWVGSLALQPDYLCVPGER